MKRLFILMVVLSSLCPVVLADTIYFPQIADGGGYSTTLTVMNLNSSSVTGTLRLFNQDGSPKILQINGVAASQFSVTVRGGGSVRLTTPNSSAATSAGWASLESTPRLQGVATFDYRFGGVLLATAGVIGTTAVSRAIVPIDLSGATASTGIALANVQNASVTVRLRLLDEAGTEVGSLLDTRLNPFGAQKQVADFITSFFGTLGGFFRGSLAVEVVGGGGVAVTGLSVKEGLLSALPALEASTPTTPVVTVPTLTSITPASGGTGSTVTATLTGTNFVSGGTTVQVTGSGITVGSAQVSGSTSLTVTLAIASSATTGDRTVTVTTSGGTSNGLTFTISAPSKSFNQTQTERLIGTWVFSYTVVSTFTDTYRLSSVQPNTSTPGDWFVFGLNKVNGTVVAGWSSVLSQFILLSPGTKIDDFFVFDLTGATAASGCYYSVDHGTTNLSSCYPMTGTRTSTSAITSNTPVSKATALDFEEMIKSEAQQFRSNGNARQPDQNLIRILRLLQEIRY